MQTTSGSVILKLLNKFFTILKAFPLKYSVSVWLVHYNTSDHGQLFTLKFYLKLSFFLNKKGASLG